MFGLPKGTNVSHFFHVLPFYDDFTKVMYLCVSDQMAWWQCCQTDWQTVYWQCLWVVEWCVSIAWPTEARTGPPSTTVARSAIHCGVKTSMENWLKLSFAMVSFQESSRDITPSVYQSEKWKCSHPKLTGVAGKKYAIATILHGKYLIKCDRWIQFSVCNITPTISRDICKPYNCRMKWEICEVPMDWLLAFQPGRPCAVSSTAIGQHSSRAFMMDMIYRKCTRSHCLADLVVTMSGIFFYTICWSQYER